MNYLTVNYFNKRGQMKIQQMAFVLVGLAIFFSMVLIIFFNIYISKIKSDSLNLKENEAIELVRKISSSPEFIWGGYDCSSCVDFDKIFILKDMSQYKKFWNIDYLKIEKISNKTISVECTRLNYPDCDVITIIGGNDIGRVDQSFVTLARWDSMIGGSGNFRHELGRIFVSGKD